LSQLTGSNNAGVPVVEVVVANTSAATDGSPLTIGVDLNVVAGDASSASSLVPRDSGLRIAVSTSLSNTDGGSSRSRGGGVSHRIGPLADVASRSTDSEADRVSTALSTNVDGAKREAVRVAVVGSIVLANSLELTVGLAVLELVSDSGGELVSPANSDAVVLGIKVDSRSGDSGSSGTG